MRCLSSSTPSKPMFTPQLYSQLQTQLSQWITPEDKRHLIVFCKNVAAILQSESGCLSHWLKYLGHRTCNARSQIFGGIEHFKDYKSAAFELTRSKLRDADALSRLLMLLATATIIAISMAIVVMAQGLLNSIDCACLFSQL
jgi:hypothetical protein